MESDEVMLAVRLTTAERTLLRWLARGHRGDVSEVVADALLDVLPALLARDAPPAAEQPGRAAPCAVTVWLPPELADLLPALAVHLASAPRPFATPSPCAALGTALRLWLRQDPARLAAGLRAMHAHPSAAHPSAAHPSAAHPSAQQPQPLPRPHVHPHAA